MTQSEGWHRHAMPPKQGFHVKHLFVHLIILQCCKMFLQLCTAPMQQAPKKQNKTTTINVSEC